MLLSKRLGRCVQGLPAAADLPCGYVFITLRECRRKEFSEAEPSGSVFWNRHFLKCTNTPPRMEERFPFVANVKEVRMGELKLAGLGSGCLFGAFGKGGN